MLLSTGTNSCASWFGTAKAFEIIASCGFDAVDYTLFNSWGVETLNNSDAEIARIHRETTDIGRSFGLIPEQAHAPMRWGKVEDKVIEKDIYGSVIACGAGSIKNLVVHPILPAATCGIADYDNVKRRNVDMMKRLLPVIRDNGVRICVENMYGKSPYSGAAAPTYPSFPEHLADYVDTMNDIAGEELFGACLDTGHMALSGIDVSYAVDVLGSRIKVLHIHDNNGLTDDHILPQIEKDAYGCSGVIDWHSFAEAIRRIGYTGTLNLESDGIMGIYGKNNAARSMAVMYAVVNDLRKLVEDDA